jgi:hypothetical protein
MLFIIIIEVISCNNKPKAKTVGYESLVPDSLICATINYFVNEASIYEFKNCDRFVDRDYRKVLYASDSLSVLRLNTIFTKEDMDFIFRQNLNSFYYKHSECLKDKILISGDTLSKFEVSDFWVKFHKKYGEGGYCSISIPLFSINHDIVIIKYSLSIGSMNASGGTYIFKKTGRNWVKIYCIESWIS